MPNSRFYSAIAATTTLQVTANPGDINIQLASSSGFPGSFPYIICLDYGAANEEVVLVTSGGPSVFTVTRGYDGTSATTHNAGAVVRHVSSAIDFTDSRTHEASTTNVHGITGAFVDTASTQTLSNKTLNSPTLNGATLASASTLTATGATVANGTFTGTTLTTPTVNGAALSGTLSGTPTFSGVNTFSAGIVTEGETVNRLNGTDIAVTVKRDADTTGRMNTTADGSMSWGPGGSAATDTGPFSRTGVGAMSLAANLSLTGTLNTTGAITSSGLLTGTDISLTAPVFTAFTPTWNGTDASLSTNVGWYYRIGKVIHYSIYGVFSTSGTTSGGISVMLPTTPYRATSPLVRQVVGQVWFDNSAAGGQTNFPNGSLGWVPIFAGDTGNTTGTLRNYKGDLFTGGFIGGPSPATTITIEGWYREA